MPRSNRDRSHEIRVKPASAKAIATLRYISKNTVSLADAQSFVEITLWSCLKRGYVCVVGRQIKLTNEGHFVLSAYSSSAANYRNNPSDFSDRVSVLLQTARKRLEERAAS